MKVAIEMCHEPGAMVVRLSGTIDAALLRRLTGVLRVAAREERVFVELADLELSDVDTAVVLRSWLNDAPAHVA